MDLDVLKSNDWEIFSPNFILVESLETPTIEDALHSDVAAYLKNRGYQLVAKTKNTLCFQKESFTR